MVDSSPTTIVVILLGGLIFGLYTILCLFIDLKFAMNFDLYLKLVVITAFIEIFLCLLYC